MKPSWGGGICKGATHGLGLKSMALDLGLELKISILTDATAAIGMSRRLGVGRVPHLDTSLLCIQNKTRSGDIALHKVPSGDHRADMLTKHVERSLLEKHIHGMSMPMEAGRPASAPRLVAYCLPKWCSRTLMPLHHDDAVMGAENGEGENTVAGESTEADSKDKTSLGSPMPLGHSRGPAAASGERSSAGVPSEVLGIPDRVPDHLVLEDEQVFVDEDHDSWAYALGRCWRLHPPPSKKVC